MVKLNQSSKKSITLSLVISVLFISLHAPFINADPEGNISGSRGANTDEGLNSFQIRNKINHDDNSFYLSDNHLKCPLFSAYLFLPFKIFGTHLPVGRSAVLLLVLLFALYVFLQNSFYRKLGLIFFLIAGMNYYIFHFTHYCLAEMIATLLLFISIQHGDIYLMKKAKWLDLITAALLCSIAYFFKIQFLYGLVILPLILLFHAVINPNQRKLLIGNAIRLIAFQLLILGLYLAFWYIPERAFFNYVMSDQTSNRFTDWTSLLGHLKFMIKHRFFSEHTKWLSLAFAISLTILILDFRKIENVHIKYWLIALISWLLIESHKLLFTYFPTRYYVSTYFAMLVLISLVIYQFISKSNSTNTAYKRVLVLSVFFGLPFINGKDYITSLKQRSFGIQECNTYLNNSLNVNDKVIGSWAPTLTWDSKVYTYPVWRGYFNDEFLLKDKPILVISEPNEDDSQQAFSSQEINLEEISDSVKRVRVNHWNINLYWINPGLYKKQDNAAYCN